jgi:hypothetical protein
MNIYHDYLNDFIGLIKVEQNKAADLDWAYPLLNTLYKPMEVKYPYIRKSIKELVFNLNWRKRENNYEL